MVFHSGMPMGSVSALAMASALSLALGAAPAEACTKSGQGSPSGSVSSSGPITGQIVQNNTSAQDGCNGPGASAFHSGHDGYVGQSAGGNSLEVTGGSANTGGAPSILMTNQGGNGGNGSGDSSVGINTTAGSGAGGGNGGAITLTVDPGVSIQATRTLVQLFAAGGTGGTGATGWNNGSGGGGGAGGTITATLAGDIADTAAGTFAVYAASQGGAGGYQNGSGRAADNSGTRGGDGGAGGTVSMAMGAAVDSAGGGVEILSLGGTGGSGGSVTAGANANGITGGNGGNGGQASLTMTGSVQSGSTGIAIAGTGGTGGNGTYGGAGARALGGNGGQGGSGGGTAQAAVGGTITGNVTAGGDGIDVSASGGTGGTGGSADGAAYTKGGNGGAGGAGGVVALTSSGQISAGGTGISAVSAGGTAGSATQSGAIAGFGGAGGTGGAGGSASVEVSGGTVTSPGIGVYVDSHGGGGGAGGEAQGIGANAGNGGNGGTGGAAAGTVDAGGAIVTTGANDAASATTSQPGLWVQSNGGTGGQGGYAGAAIGTAGGGGLGGAGGNVTATVSGGVTTSGAYAHGVLAQTVGGTGGNGNNAFGFFYAGGGSGLTGGNGGAVTLQGSGGSITTTGTGASGMIGQSIGGGGGAGGNALAVSNTATVALGGNGGLGGDGSTATATLGDTLITRGDEAAALTLQSVGGAGGNGGSATSFDLGVLTLAIGGDGQGGGNGGTVTVTNSGLIATTGLQSGGIAAQSVGGGGGTGGAGVATGAGVINIAVAVGGNGGTGGNGGAVTVTNQMQVTTLGSDSYGLKAQSISGGGGEGGLATSTAIGLSPDPEVPAGAMTVSVGGKGGAGGTAAAVAVHNAGLVTTAGDGAMAMIGQSIGGGGGNGGDSSAWSYSAGASTNISGAIAIGGSGGAGGTGGGVTMDNAALVITTGESAYGMLGQSIGGGGGQGSKGDASAGAGEGDDLSLGGAISVGGSGGAASQGGTVTLTNLDNGGILTQGDGANAMLAQSIGGGGGAAGGGVGKANGGTLSFSVTVGGNGGAGGNGGQVSVANDYALRTTGADADAMVAQSIGGGGGKGGKGASTSGGAEDPKDATQDLVARMGTAFGLGPATQTIADDVIKVGDGVMSGFTGQADLGTAASSGGDLRLGDGDDDDGDATSIEITVAIGGQGGAGGTGGTVGASNEGWIVTTGAKSDGIFAQSVGGGGGAGGAASSSDSGSNSVQFGVGGAGNGGGGGAGGAVSVDNEAEAIVQTYGIASNALVAQSVGGGGGKGGFAGSKTGALESLSLSLGGSGGASGDGGTVVVTNDVSATIATTGKNAIGIVAQSIGGGGGIAHVLSKDQTGNQSGGGASSTTPDDYDLSFAFGGKGGNAGQGGAVTVQMAVASSSYPLGGIATTGRNAYGILAQSVGGGGGLAAGGQVTNTDLFGYGGSGGDGGDGGTVTVNAQGRLATTGDGAVGVWAQSIGGGGGIAGDTAASASPLAFTGQAGQSGTGGTIGIAMLGGTFTTAGANAPVIFAQSIGGGGGQVTTANGAYTGTAGGAGNGGNIDIEIGTDQGQSTNILTATGAGSAVMKAQTVGQQGGSVTVNIGANSTLTGAPGAPVLSIESGSGSQVTNSGILHGEAGGVIAYTGGIIPLYNNPGGEMYGDIRNGAAILNQGSIHSGTAIDASFVMNSASFSIGLTDSPVTLQVNGDFNNLAAGTLYANVDFSGDTGDLIQVSGGADIDGTLSIDPITLAKNVSVPVVTAGGTLSDSGLTTTGTGSAVYTYTATVTGSDLSVSVDGDFSGVQHGLGAVQQGVGAHLQGIWDRGDAAMGREFALIAQAVDSQAGYRAALDELSGRATGTIGASRHLAGQRVMAGMAGCPDLDPAGLIARERNCYWGRVTGGEARQDSGGDRIGFTDRATTVQIGGQWQTDDGWFVGGSLAYEDSTLTANEDAGRATGKSAFAGLVAKREAGAWTLTGGLVAGHGWFDTSRNIDLAGVRQVATAAPETAQVGLHGRLAWQQPFAQSYLKAYLDLDATWLRTDAYAESGAGGFSLEVDAEHDLRLAAAPMVEIGGLVPLRGGMVLKPYAAAGAVFYDDNDWTTTARFAGAPAGSGSFTTVTDLPETMGQIRAGLQLNASERFQVRLEYQGQFADGFQSQTGSLRLNWLF